MMISDVSDQDNTQCSVPKEARSKDGWMCFGRTFFLAASSLLQCPYLLQNFSHIMQDHEMQLLSMEDEGISIKDQFNQIQVSKQVQYVETLFKYELISEKLTQAFQFPLSVL